jgi:hypothetical protein
MGVGGIPGPARHSVRQYVSGLCVATLGLCAAGWLALAPAASGYLAGRAPLQAAPLQAALHRAAAAGRRGGTGLTAYARSSPTGGRSW